MGAFLNDAAIADDGDAVSISYRLQSVGNDDCGHLSTNLVAGSRFKEMIQSLLHNSFTFTVQSAGDNRRGGGGLGKDSFDDP